MRNSPTAVLPRPDKVASANLQRPEKYESFARCVTISSLNLFCLIVTIALAAELLDDSGNGTVSSGPGEVQVVENN